MYFEIFFYGILMLFFGLVILYFFLYFILIGLVMVLFCLEGFRGNLFIKKFCDFLVKYVKIFEVDMVCSRELVRSYIES